MGKIEQNPAFAKKNTQKEKKANFCRDDFFPKRQIVLITLKLLDHDTRNFCKRNKITDRGSLETQLPEIRPLCQNTFVSIGLQSFQCVGS
jgi:hypothetical protein